MENNGKIEHRLTTVEVKIENIDEQVSNHIPTQIRNLNTKLWWFVTIAFATLLTGVANLLNL